ncbi:MAG: cell envelope biogenesis protein TolA, partial [Alphaproteobacteria bacterium]
MRRLSPAILGSIALHAGVAGLALVSWPRTEMALPPTIASVPVTIVSSVEIAAAPADNPS